MHFVPLRSSYPAVSTLLLMLAATTVLGCNDKGNEDSTAPNFVGPVLSHTPEVSVGQGGELLLTLTATDEDGLGNVSMYHRTGDVLTWALMPMEPGPDNTFTATLSGDELVYPSVDYYFKVTDAADIPATSYLPATDTTAEPFSVVVTVAGATLPFVEDFEPDEAGVETDLASLGWGSASTAFRGYPWQTSQAQAYSGETAAFHPQGYADAAASKDWLISPAIDLTSVESAQLTWREYGNFTDTANHALYISTTGRAPADGADNPYTLVTALPAPAEDAWSRSNVVDLSAYVGNTVYLAWYFEGTGADDWYLDDVRVEGLQADLTETWAIDPAPVHPGESTTLTVTVTNTATVDAAGVDVVLTFPSGGVSTDVETITLDSIAAGATATAEFPVTVDSAQADNRYVPMQIAVDWDANAIVADDPFLVGYASTATVAWDATADGSLELVIGVGDPEAPTWTRTIYADNAVAGPVSASLDVTDMGDLLPAAAGDMRWWAEATTASGGSFTEFTVSYGGVEQAATVLPAVPALGSDYCYVPEPPSFLVTGTTSPATLSPGTAGASLTLSITDTGAATDGPVIATLSSTDPDVTVIDGGPLTVSASAMSAGQRVNLSGFSFDVAASHTDSTDVNLDLTLDDGAESWLVPIRFDVPYPVFTVTSVEINDDGGDGLLDPDESGTLKIYVTNTGDQNASGTVSGVLSLAGSSVASADVQTASEVFGSLSAGSTQDARFDVTVTGGVTGDALDLSLALHDSSRTYTTTTQLVLGETPWISLSTTDDADNDALRGWDFDMVNGRYRVMDGMLQLRMRSSVAYDPGTLFVESWGTAAGADYIYYRIVAQSGGATLEGYDSSGFRSLPDPTLTYPDAYTIQVEFPVSDLGLFSDRIQLGFGSGWCGAPEFYCDQFPDMWGYPYDSFSTADWFTLEW